MAKKKAAKAKAGIVVWATRDGGSCETTTVFLAQPYWDNGNEMWMSTGSDTHGEYFYLSTKRFIHMTGGAKPPAPGECKRYRLTGEEV